MYPCTKMGGKINRRKTVVRSSVMPNRRINRCQILTIGGIKTYALYLHLNFQNITANIADLETFRLTDGYELYLFGYF